MIVSKMSLRVMLLVVICVNVVNATLTLNRMHLVADVIKSFDKPTYVAAFVNWNSSLKLQFSHIIKMHARSTVLFIQNIKMMDDQTPAQNILFLVELESPNVKEIFVYSNATGKFRSPYRWLILETNPGAHISDVLSSVMILPDSEVIISSSSNNRSFVLKMVYQYSVNKSWTFEYFGIWRQNGLSLSKNITSTSTAMRRKNLQQKLIKVASVSLGRTYPDYNSYKNEQINMPVVASYWQMKHLFEFLNATNEIVVYNTWGIEQNGTWNGMIGGMLHGDLEISAILTFVNKKRMDVLSYLSQPIEASVVFVFREPRLSYQNNLFLLPFRPTVWYCIFGFMFIIILILYVNSMWELRKYGKDNATVDNETWLRPDIGEITIFAISAVTQQGSASELKGGLGRVVIFLLLAICVILYTSYCASIVVLLQASSNRIRTLSDLLNSKLELGVEDTTYNKLYFSTVKEPVRKAIYEKKIAPRGSKSNFMTLEEGVRKLQKEPFAFNMFTPMGYTVIETLFQEHEKCGLREIAYIQENAPWFSCKKTSHYKEMYKIGLYRLKEHGIYERVSNIFYGKKPLCSVHEASFVSVNIVDFYPALLVLLYGILGSLGLLCVEILVHRRRMRSIEI